MTHAPKFLVPALTISLATCSLMFTISMCVRLCVCVREREREKKRERERERERESEMYIERVRLYVSQFWRKTRVRGPDS